MKTLKTQKKPYTFSGASASFFQKGSAGIFLKTTSEAKSSFFQAASIYPRLKTVPEGNKNKKAEAPVEDQEAGFEQQLAGSKGGGRPLDDETRGQMEQHFGVAAGQTRVHTGNDAIQMNQQLGADAFTHGSDIYFNWGKYQPKTKEGDKLLAHEMTHVVQQAPKSGSGQEFIMAQRTGSGRTGTAADRRQRVNMAAQWLDRFADQVQAIRRSARVALATTSGRAAGPQAFHRILNQEVIRRLMGNAITVFETHRSLPNIRVTRESPEQTRLGEAYTRAVEQLGLAIREALTNAGRLAPNVKEAEEARYESNFLRWVAANPSTPVRAGLRTTFTQEEVNLSARRHQVVTREISRLIGRIHEYNLSGGRARQIRDALNVASHRLVRDPATRRVEAQADAGLRASIRPVLNQVNGIIWAVDQAVDQLQRAGRRTRAFAASPARHAGVGNLLQTHFSTRDPGYATLVADRLARLERELRGQGSLAIYARDPADQACTGVGSGGSSFTAAHADANEFRFCGTPQVGNQSIVSTVMHEAAHAVIPNLGAQGAVRSSADTPGDRAYEFERIYSRLSTEEALANAETYSFYVDQLLGIQSSRAAAPQDILSGCTNATPVMDAVARATYRLRLAAMWARQNAQELQDATVLQDIITSIRRAFPRANAAKTREVVGHLATLDSRLQRSLAIDCRDASDREAQRGALVYGRNRAAFSSGRLRRTRRRYPSDTLRICPGWFQESTESQENTVTAILILYYQNTIRASDVMNYVTIIRQIQEGAHPSVAGRSLSQHRAADATGRSRP